MILINIALILVKRLTGYNKLYLNDRLTYLKDHSKETAALIIDLNLLFINCC